MINQKRLLKYLYVAIFAVTLMFAQPSLAADSVMETGTRETEVLSQTEEQAPEATATEGTPEAGSEAEHEEIDPGLLGLLGINWKLFIAQLVNFAIVLFVLWKWVFKPVSSGLEARTAKIEKSLHDATNIEEAKKEFEDWKSGAMSTARAEAAQIVSDAKTEALVVKKEIADDTKSEQENIIARARAAIEQEKQQAIVGIKTEAADLVVMATQKILGDKLDATKDKELIKKALSNI